jgi:hypothetical protein
MQGVTIARSDTSPTTLEPFAEPSGAKAAKVSEIHTEYQNLQDYSQFHHALLHLDKRDLKGRCLRSS